MGLSFSDTHYFHHMRVSLLPGHAARLPERIERCMGLDLPFAEFRICESSKRGVSRTVLMDSDICIA